MNIFKDTKIGDGNHYVYYQRLEEDGRFKTILKKTNAAINRYTNQINNINLDIPSLLRSQATAEKAKEIQILKELSPNNNINFDNMPPEELINQLNEFMGLGKGIYEKYLEYLRDIYPTTQGINISPVVTSYMSNELASLINKKYGNSFVQSIANLIRNNASNEQIEEYSKKLAEQIEKDFINNDNNMTSQLLEKIGRTNQTLGEEYMVWEKLFNSINNDLNIRNEFIISIFSSFNLQNKIENTIKNLKKANTTKGIKNALRIKITSNSAQTGGLMYEAVNAAMQGLAFKGKNAQVYSTSRLSNKGTTDMMTLFSESITFDLQPVIEQKIAQLTTGKQTKEEAIKQVTEFTHFLKTKLSNGFIIYGNDKSYKLSSLKAGSGYFQGGRRKIEQLPTFMKQYNISITDETVDLVINTIPKAILEGNTTVQNFLTQALAGQVAKLLFDDWTTIGDQTGNFNAIHVFHLSGIMVPLSYLLQKMAEAAEQALNNLIDHPSAYFQVNFDLPSIIKYPDSRKTTADIIAWKRAGEKLSNGEKSYLHKAWNVQRDEALDSTFGIDFLSNFNQLINQLLVSLGK